MTDKQLRHKTVAVAVIYDPQQGFLLWNNKRWGGYAFPMKQRKRKVAAEQTALQAITDRDFPLDLPNATADALEETGWFGRSKGAREDTYYDYHVVEVNPGQPLDPADLDPDLRFFSYDQLQASTSVTESTRAIATSLVENQDVVVPVIARERRGDIEFLLVDKSQYGYFFPSIRRKTHGPLDGLAKQAVLIDTAFVGELQASYCGEVSHQRPATRFGAANRRYRFYLVCVCFPGVDLFEPGNPLAKAPDARQAARAAGGEVFGARGYWSWFTVDEIKTRDDISPDMQVILLDAIECAKKCRSKE